MQKDILLINKPKHWTSNDVIRKVKHVLKVKKVGHAGTLDPLASGLLILGINEGTKKLNDLLLDDKVYIATIHFGYETQTYDLEGNVTYYKPVYPSLETIKVNLELLKSEYWQTPPLYSAIKLNGKKAYEYARKNQTVQLNPRLVSLFDYKILSYKEHVLEIELKVSKGFYVRSFARDLGRMCQTYATLANLKRIAAGEFKLSDAYEIGDLDGNWIKP